MTEWSDIRSKIKSLLVECLELKIAPERIGDDDILFERRLGLDSVAAIELLTAIEEEFDIEFRDEDLHVDLFQSVNTLAQIVEKLIKLQKGDAPDN